jgi:hypothetical protein
MARPSSSRPRGGLWLAALALGALLSAACVPGVSTPTPAAVIQSKPPAVPDKVLQQAPAAPTPPAGTIVGATPAAPGASGGYPVPGPATTPVSRTAPGAAYP